MMKTSSALGFFRESLDIKQSFFLLSLLIHGLLIGMLAIKLKWPHHSKPKNIASIPVIEATVISKDLIFPEKKEIPQKFQQKDIASEQLSLLRQKKKAQEEAKQKAEAERKAKEEAERKQKEAEEIARKKAEEEQKQAELAKKKAQEEAKQKAEAERKTKEEAERKQKEAEEIARKKAEEEQKQAELAKKKAQEEAKQKAEAKRKQRELQDRIDAEKKNESRIRDAIERFIPQLQMRVQRYWVRPPGVQNDMVTVLRVDLLPSGDVNNVTIIESSGDPVFDRSAQAAVYRASPLPIPTDKEAAKQLKSFNFKFCPNC
ncbi:cell envelope integrity protein TolA [Candidatus Nitrosacidococcus tergens]|uniref:Cell division and transport-associated protein TolA n=1 Tax=Candidatus Nitrosacidococcus tergens TaxID=553981 RepID=A0A7G1QBJ3_9GAMM|nr:cell envelope integrity protein TolA [Candidatus Nitrosacidococcus tergens]CAB1277449.1 Cell division and transport-associated protein TolA [Candidatus Nitrosacidococcus tergens]